MKIRIIQTITNTLNENREVLKSVEQEAYRMYPAVGKALRNKLNGKVYTNAVTVSLEHELADWEEIDYNIDEDEL